MKCHLCEFESAPEHVVQLHFVQAHEPLILAHLCATAGEIPRVSQNSENFPGKFREVKKDAVHENRQR